MRRIPELDALRGLAALSVVILHFSDMFYPDDPRVRLQPTVRFWGLLASPFNRGHEAVLLFFALSGFVLALPYLAGRGQSYPIFVLRRIIRIYGPYLVALALAVGGAACFHRPLDVNQWSNLMWSRPVEPHLVLQHVLFLGNYEWTQYNVAFWSLVYEMRISFLFPLMFVLVKKLPTRWTLTFAALCTACAHVLDHFFPGNDATTATLTVAAVFLCGILLALHLEAVIAWYRAQSALQQAGLFVAVLFLHITADFLPHLNRSARFVGAIGWIVFALGSERAKRILNYPAIEFLGRISYSLYLVHATVLFSLAFLIGRRISHYIFFPLYIAAAIGGAVIFYKFAEEPFIDLSRRAGRQARAAAPLAEPV